MLSQSTTFVIGAGASSDFDFPTGEGLQDRITEYLRLNTDARRFESDRMWYALVPLMQQGDFSQLVQRYAGAAQRISEGMPLAASIDNFLHTHQQDNDIVLIGKIAIALAIVEAEAASPLAVRAPDSSPASPLSTERYRTSWYFPFMKLLTMGTRSDDPRAFFRNIRFVVFNYDRCLELVLLYTLKGYYGLQLDQALEVLAGIDIIHPYGSIGPLSDSVGPGIPFGYRDADIGNIASGIKTFTESVDERIVQQARLAVADADTLVFLGFGFLPQNMNLLRPKANRQAMRIYATTFGVSETDELVIREKLQDFVRTPNDVGKFEFVRTNSAHTSVIDTDNGTCRNLIENHRMRLLA